MLTEANPAAQIRALMSLYGCANLIGDVDSGRIGLFVSGRST
jgi:hypothetical protein